MNEYIRKRVKKISYSNSEDQMKMDLYSTMIPFLLSTEEFNRNIDIREFTNKLILKKEVRDYLFGNRTQIVARMIREIDNFNDAELRKNIEIFQKYCQDDSDDESDNENEKNLYRKKKEEEKILKIMNKYSRNKGQDNDE